MHNLASDLATGLVTPIGSMLGGNMQKPSGLAYCESVASSVTHSTK